ncbi:MAG: chemotaxis protein CheW [Gemmatimonadales bacterium]
MDLSQYGELFLAESTEHLGAINQQLLEWERDPATLEPIRGIFRSVHTIKGMAATMGYSSVSNLAHHAENLLDVLRSGEKRASEDTIELLFRTADALERAIEAAVAGRSAEFAEDLIAVLDEAAGGFREVKRRPSLEISAPSAARSAGPGVAVEVLLRPDSILKGARAAVVLQRMDEIGKVLDVRPSHLALESDDFGGRFSFRIETTAGADVITREIKAAGDVASVTVGAEDSRRETGTVGRTRHVRIDLRRLDALMDLMGELVTARDQLLAVSAKLSDPALDDVAAKISQLAGVLQSEIIQARMTPVWQVFDRFPRLVRDLARELGKSVSFQVEGKEIELDRAILDDIADPLVHLLRNSVDHGIETPDERERNGKPREGRIVLTALRERATVAIRVSDDGRGIDRQKILADAKENGLVASDVDSLTDEAMLRVLARPGFSTAKTVSAVSGRGVGIDAVVAQLRALGGGLEIRSEPGEGTTFTLRLPVSLAIVRALMTQVGDENYVLPITHVAETLDLDPAAVTQLEERAVLSLRDEVVPLLNLRELVGVSGRPPVRSPVVVLQIGDRRSALVVDSVAGQQEIVVKSFEQPKGMLPIFGGATILGDGSPALILDAGGLV